MIPNNKAADLLADLDLGSAVAESDNLLETARVETSVFDDLLADRVDLILGTKGSGKTALYRIFVDFLTEMMLVSKKIIIAHGVQDRQDSVFLAYARRSETETRALRGLLRTISLFRSDRIRVKVFLRDDILDQIVAGRGFTALTHAAARRSDTLRWSEEDILTMIVRRIFVNAKIARYFGVNTRLLTSSIEYQKQQFYKIFVDTASQSKLDFALDP
jgi:hypothetical protein